MQQMEQREASPIELPEKFEQYFQTFLSNTEPQISYDSIKQSLIQIYQAHDKENNIQQLVSQRLKTSGLSQNDLQLLIEVFQNLIQINLKFNKILTKAINLEFINQQFKADLKFNILDQKSLLDFKQFCRNIDENHNLQIDDIEGSVEQLVEFLSLQNDQLKEEVQSFLSNAFQLYQDFSQQNKAQVFDIFLKRNDAFTDIMDNFEKFDFGGENLNLTNLILSFYSDQSLQKEEQPKELIEQFVNRVRFFFSTYTDNKKKNKCSLIPEKQKKNLEKLFELRSNLVKEKIIQIITIDGGYSLFNTKKPQSVTDDIVRKIYNLPLNQPIQYAAQGEGLQDVPTNQVNLPDNMQLNHHNKLETSYSQIPQLNEQIKGIEQLLKQHQQTCLEIMIRKLQIHIRQNKFEEGDNSAEKVRTILKKYNLDVRYGSIIDDICCQKQLYRKIPLMLNLRRDIFGLNLEHIKQVKNQLQTRKQCKNADAIIIIGQTGVGKTLLIVGLSGYQLVYVPQTNDFRPRNRQVAKKLIVSNNTMSETRWANVSYICGAWTKKKIIIIDTPGLEDNRSSQIDITNNIATVKMLKNLNSARFVVVLSEKQFGDRWYDNIKKIIKGISKYITEVSVFSNNLTFVLSKGLTVEKFQYQFNAFQKTPAFQKERWDENEQILIRIIKNKIQTYKSKKLTAIQIKNPSTHNYKELAEHILSGKETTTPGDYISTSYSREAQQHIGMSINYLKAMCLKTLQLSQFQMLEYYLREIYELESVIPDKKQFVEIHTEIYNYFQNKLNQCENYLQKFYKQSSDSQNLMKFKEIKQSMSQLEKYPSIIKTIFNDNDTPKVKIQKLIDITIKEDSELLNEPSKIELGKRKKVLMSLKLIKQFKSESEYNFYFDKIQTSNQAIINKLKQLLKQKKFKQVQWADYCLMFKNMFNLDEVSLNQIQDMKRLCKIIKQYLDEDPEQMQQIRNFLDISKSNSLQGQFEDICSNFIQKLNKLTNHYVIRQLIQPKLKDLMAQLQQLIIFYRQEKQDIMRDLDKIDTHKVKQVIMYEKNSKEIYCILTKFGSSQMNNFKSQKEEQSTLNQIKDRLCEKINFLQHQIDKLCLNPQNIDPSQFDKILRTIRSMIDYIKKRRDAVASLQQKSNPQNSRIIKRQLEFMDQAIKDSQSSLLKVYRKIQKTAQISKVQDYKLNYKLIISDLILTEFILHLGVYFQDKNDEMQKINHKLREKILVPQIQLSKATFTSDYEYSKLLGMLNYMQELDSMLISFIQKADGFNFQINFTTNQKIIQILQKAFAKIVEDNKQFKGVQELLTYHLEVHIASSNELKDAKSKKKQDNLNSLCYDLLNKSVKYIKSYQHIKNILKNFDKISDVEKFKNEHQNLDYLHFIVQRLKQIRVELQSQHAMIDINRKKLIDYHKQFKFLNGIYEKVKNQQQDQVYNDIEMNIQKKLLGYMTDFERRIQILTQSYKQIKNGANFDSLIELLNHEDFKDDANKKKFSQLLAFIAKQYNKELGELFFIIKSNEQRLKNFEVFINVYQFMAICKQSNFKINFTFQDMLDDVCESFFDSIGQSFNNSIDLINKGQKVDEYHINQLKSYEKRINFYIKNRYQDYKKNKSMTDNYEKKFTKQRVEAENKVKFCYIQKGQVDRYFKDYFNNASSEHQAKMKKIITQKNKRQENQLEQFFNQDHQKMYELIEKKIEGLEYLPEPLKVQVTQTLQMINKKKQLLQFNVKENITKFIQQSNGVNILQQFTKAKQKKSKNLVVIVKNGIEKYFNEQQKKINFKNLNQLKQVLKNNDQLVKSQTYKTLARQEDLINKIQEQFICQTKNQAKAQIDYIHQQIVKFKKELLLQNPKEEFKIYQIKKINTSSSSKAIELFNLTKQFPVLKQQNMKIKNVIETEIKKQKQTFEDNFSKIQSLSAKINEKKNNLYKSQVEQTLRASCISKVVYESFKIFNEVQSIDEKVQLEGVQQFEKMIKQIQNYFLALYKELKSLKIQDYVANDTKDRIKAKINNIEENINSLNTLGKLFVHVNQIPLQVANEIKQHNKAIYTQFLQMTQKEIYNCFQCEKDLDRGEKARQNNVFCRVVRQNKFYSFQLNLIEKGELVEKKIQQKFKDNVQKIKSNIDNDLQLYKQTLQQFEIIKKKLQNQIAQKLKTLKEKEDQIEQFMNKERQLKIKNIQDQGPEKVKKIQWIKKEIQGEKTSKLGMIKLQIEMEKKKQQELAKSQQQKLHTKITQMAKQFARQLIINRRARSYYNYNEAISKYHISISQLMDQILKKYKTKFIGTIYNCLKTSESSYSEILIDEQKVFSRYKALEFADLAKGQTFDKLILQVPQVKGDQEKVKTLLDKYQKYQKIYKDVLEKYCLSQDYNSYKIQIIDTISDYSERLKKEYFNSLSSKLQKYELLAYILALWTILKSDMDDDKNVIFVYKPHPGQILAIFLLLEFYNNNFSNKISKCMVQVSTGEGKSVILGALSAYLALVGFEVYEACYSLYLSQRDYKDFEPLFTCLNIKEKINYNIFAQIFKMMLDDGPKNTFKDKMQNFLNTKSLWDSIKNYFNTLIPNHKFSNNILLIDEADVFLDENYIGESFFPGINLQSKSLKLVFDLIWKQKENIENLDPTKIIESKQFTSLCDELGHKIFKEIVVNQVHAMIRDLENYSKDVYVVVNGKIFYREGDGLSDKIHYGYRTVWAYYHQHYANNSVSTNQLIKQICIKLVIASFSYAKLPTYFKSILGVTGTLEAMAKPQKDILIQDFQVKKSFVQPSIYPKGNRKISFRKCKPIDLNNEIIANLIEQHNKGRPVIIFFKTKFETYNFFDSPQFKPFRTKSSVITYEVQPEDRDVRIQTSTLSGRITLLTDEFSRGTDFKLKVKNSAQNPGLHVISSFVPKSFCDYIQLAGRTGRSGKNGSVMIFMVQDAHIQPEDVEVKQIVAQQAIKDKDDKYWQAKITDIKMKVQAANIQHDKNSALYTSNPTLDEVLRNLKQLNVEPEIKRANSKTAICIDGTASMSNVFFRVVTVVKNAIPAIYQVIKEANIEGCFDIKFVIYRNYNSSKAKIIEYSNYENKAETLSKWIGGIEVQGGWGNEAIEICLNHLNSLQKLNQFIIIGDARANTQNETRTKRKTYHHIWNNKQAFKETFYEYELRKLINKKVKGHSYYLNPGTTKDFFEDLSRRTEGISEQFKITDPNATKLFTDFVANRILENLGECFDSKTQKKMLEIYSKVSRKIY